MKMTEQVANASTKNQPSAECHPEARSSATTKTKLWFRGRRGLGLMVTNSISFLLLASAHAATPSGGPSAYYGTFVSGANPARAPQNNALPLNNQNALVLQMHDVGHDAAEPSLGVDPKGAIFYAAAAFDGIGGTAKTTVLRSTDDGLSWQNVSPSVENTEAHPFTLDPYLYVDRAG